MTRRLGIVLLLSCVLVPAAALAEEPAPAAAARADIKQTFGFVPGFLDKVPDSALPGAWQEMKTLQMSPATALPGKVKELIGLAVAAQVPCRFCTYAHTEFAELEGASPQEVGEAVMLASMTRHWSTVLQGQQTDLAKFRALLKQAMASMQSQTAPPKFDPSGPKDAEAAYAEIKQVFGTVPDFLARFPREGIAGAWRELRDVQLSPATALSGKHKSLIGLAVASQIPCRFCLAADTEFAKMEGATDREIQEAIAMAALTRHWSTYLHGMQIDEVAFKRDIDKLVRGAKQAAAVAHKATPSAEPKVATAMKH